MAFAQGETYGHAHIVRACYGKRCLDKTLQKSKKVSKITTVIEGSECARVVPISEAKPVTKWVAAEHDNKCKDNQALRESELCV